MCKYIYDVKCTFEPKLRLQSKDCHVVTRSLKDQGDRYPNIFNSFIVVAVEMVKC
jgi:hypothetical protein